MGLFKVTGLISITLLTLSACGDSVKTKEQLSNISVQDFAIDFCKTAMSANLEQLELMADSKYVEQIRSLSKGKEFDKITGSVECSEVNLTEKANYTIAKFGGKIGLSIKITKKDGFYLAGA